MYKTKVDEIHTFGCYVINGFTSYKMRQFLCPILLTVVLTACNSKAEKSVDSHSLATSADKAVVNAPQITEFRNVKIEFNEPVAIDSSSYVMYPLVLQNKDSYESTRLQNNYWNIIFYNTTSGQYHLLDNKRKMIIHSYGTNTSSPYSSNEVLVKGYFQTNEVIYFSVTTFDYNNDGKITLADPTYLFISDKSGNNFRQISPDSLNVKNWQTVGDNKILIEAVRDSNKDLSFDQSDETIPFIYDLSKGGISKEVFSREFNTSVKKLFKAQWAQKE